jgi:hypothetical protein
MSTSNAEHNKVKREQASLFCPSPACTTMGSSQGKPTTPAAAANPAPAPAPVPASPPVEVPPEVAFYTALTSGDTATVERMLAEKTYDPNDMRSAPRMAWFKKYGNITPLHVACVSSHLGAVKALKAHNKLDSNRFCNVLTLEGSFGGLPGQVAVSDKAPLHLAVLVGATEVVNVLINEKPRASVSTVDTAVFGFDSHGGRLTALHYAAQIGDAAALESMKLLLAAAFDKQRCVSASSQNKWTPLHMAAFYGHLDAAKLLLEAGADRAAVNQVDALDKEPGLTPTALAEKGKAASPPPRYMGSEHDAVVALLQSQ